jgi:hypothetical protein
MDKNRFLDDNNIIKIDRDTLAGESLDNIEMNLYPDVDSESFDESDNFSSEVHSNPPIENTQDMSNDSVQYIQPKTREELIIELIDKFQSQFILKEVETELFRDLIVNHSKNTKERDLNRQKMLNLKDDMRLIQKKIEILKGFLNE